MNNQKFTPEEFLQKRTSEALSGMLFPEEFVSSKTKDLLRQALKYNSLFKLEMINRCEMTSTYRNFITFERKFIVPEILAMIDILRAATPVEMGQTLEENMAMIDEIVIPMKMKYHEILDAVQKPIIAEINSKLKLSNSVPLGKEIFKPS